MAKRHYSETQRPKGESDFKGGRTALLAVVICILGLLETPQAKNLRQANSQGFSLVFTQAPHSMPAQGPVSRRKSLRDKSRIVSLAASGTFSVLTPEFFSAATPSVSFDAARILFAGKKTAKDRWDIWEMKADGSDKRQITRNFGNCAEPRYLALSAVTPPEFADKVRWIIFTSDAANSYDELGEAPATALYIRNLEPVEARGLFTRRATFSLSSVFSPLVLSDGRVLFTSHQPGGVLSGKYPLMVTNWDGTGLNLFYGSTAPSVLNSMTCEMPDRKLVFVESDGASRELGGQLAQISFARPLHSYRALSKGPGAYCDPHPLPDGQLLVSHRTDKGSYGLFTFDLNAGGTAQKIYDDPKWDELNAVPLVASREPQGLLSAVADSDSTGDLQCMNVYDSDVPESRQIGKGEVKRVRLVEGVPYSLSERIPARPGNPSVFPLIRTRILGEAPVEPDGSFYVRVPADTPFFIQMLDDQGMSLRTLRSWIWVRRGTSRGCIGCHEDRELAPENRATQALIKAQPQSMAVPPEQRRRIDFRQDIMTVLERRCVSCHSPRNPAGGVELSSTPTHDHNVAYDKLLNGPSRSSSAKGEPYILPGSANKSALIQMLTMKISMPTNGRHHPAASLGEGELKTLIEWIDLGARWEN